MQKLLLVFGIPLVFIAGIVAFETGQLQWLGIVLLLGVARFFMRRAVVPGDEIVLPRRDNVDLIDKGNVSPTSSNHPDGRP